jgi:hypothetical protein
MDKKNVQKKFAQNKMEKHEKFKKNGWSPFSKN